MNDWRQAYLKFKNAGVVTANEQGVAILKFRKPQGYTVPTKGALPPHVHYRVCMKDGFLGRVETVKTDHYDQSDQKEVVENFLPAEFPHAEPPANPAEDNSLYYVAQEIENKMLPLDEMGIDESPQPAGSDYEKAFLMSIPQ
jgi:protocatechuate 3,4-dioxygenase beta subunit